ncbi:protoporphyrinogen/coproporphyrinogen oxidase [Georgenia ruanii]|uniref:NAD(P)-binding protein n=1 Tax=Georgenia ruanii TaxID=348442 RepID=A0A7J9UU09_9MICO|nr:FAD-dependent oxidoreductase [Georgenia ruanii]MPV87992.1 NAD(P)-binding protein [Georgenia ruanii]
MTPTPDVLVVGAGMAGLTAAHALAARGLRAVVLEAGADVGGLVAAGTVGGYEVDLGAEAFALRRPEVLALAEGLGLAVERPAGRSWVWAEDGDAVGAVPIPAGSLLGIPANPDDADVRLAIGPDGAARAAQDAHLGPEVGADAADLAALVRARMGEAVLARLVRPVAGGIHNADPADLAVDSVAPGLRAALAREGSLAAAVRALLAAAPPGAAVATTTGGLFRLPRALRDAVVAAGGEVRTGSRVTALRRVAAPGPGAGERAGASRGGSGADGAEAAIWEAAVTGPGGPATLRAPRVVLATPGGAALDLLRGLVDVSDVALPAGSAITHVTLAVRATALDAAPRGSGLLVPPGAAAVRAKALTHASAKWAWLAAATAPGEHVLRVSYGRPGERTDDVEPALALRDAATLLGVPLPPASLLDARVVARAGALAASTPAHLAQVARLGERVRALPGLRVTGAWVAGTGLAAVVAHAQAVAGEISQ